jgi:hypothetical protein
VDKVIPMRSKSVSAEARKEAHLRAFLVFEFLPTLAPKAGVNERRRLADEMLLMCAGYERRVRMTPALMSELLSVHSSCVHDQEGCCPLLVSVGSLCWEINQALGVGNEEDRAFKRHDPMCAAKPLGECHFDEEETDGDVRRADRDPDRG